MGLRRTQSTRVGAGANRATRRTLLWLTGLGLAFPSGCGAEAPALPVAETRVAIDWGTAPAQSLEVPLDWVERTFTQDVEPATTRTTVRYVLTTPLDLSPYESLVIEAETGSTTPKVLLLHDSEGKRFRWSTTPDAWPNGAGRLRVPLPREARRGIERLALSFRGVDSDVKLQALRFERDPSSPAPALFDDGQGDRRRGWLLGPTEELAATVPCPRGEGDCELTFSYLPVAHQLPPEGVTIEAEIETSSGVLERSWIARSPGWNFVRLECPAEAGEPVRVVLRPRLSAEARVVLAEAALSVERPDPRTVLLITSDTHRGDHVGTALDSAPVRTPNLDALAERGVRFLDCFSSTNITVPSHVALFTASTPRETGVQDNQSSVSQAAWTLAEAFASAGWATVAVTSLNLLDPEHCGLGQGFERYATTDATRSAQEAVARLEGWLPDYDGRSTFVWLHVFDAHGPYQPAAEFVRWPQDRDPVEPMVPEGARIPDWAAKTPDVEYIRALYRGEVAAVDAALGTLLQRSRIADGIVVFTADHGENLGQHGIWWGHKNVYKDTLHVPLLIAGPEGLAGRVHASPVRQIDIGRTVLEMVGLDPGSFGGSNLLTASTAEEPVRFALSGGALSASVNDAGWHLVGALDDATSITSTELFDLSADPTGETDVAAEHPARVERLRSALTAWLSEGSDAALAGERNTDAETLRRLAELGYLDEEE